VAYKRGGGSGGDRTGSILVSRVDFTDRHENVLTRLVALDADRQTVIGHVGSAELGVESVIARFVQYSDVLMVLYSRTAKHAAEEGGTRLNSTGGGSRSILVANFTRMLLTCCEETGHVERVTRMSQKC